MRNHFVHKLTISTLLGVFALGSLSACGIKGELKTPPPLWGDKTQIDKPQVDKVQVDKTEVEKQDTEKSKP